VNKDFHDVLRALSAENAEFLIVGAYAMAVHGHPRATGDLDIWVHATKENAERVFGALAKFGAPLARLKPADFCDQDVVFQMGIAPNRVDILTSIDGVEFPDAWKDRMMSPVEGLSVPVIGREHLRQNKRASGRPKDLQDLAMLDGAN
jgi:hypothetical protein